MNFARTQLEKYGWTDGKGLGKYENGISEALKPKLKRSVTGVGHDPASEFNEHWWSALYDKAAGNVEVEEKNGKTKKIKTKDSQDFIITNSTWQINKKRKEANDEQYSDYFVRTAVLGSGGSKTVNIKESDSEEEKETKDVFKMTDEELFAACEGRTAHKGARHGLKALGKLARIAQQEQMLLSQPQYEGYSHSKKNNKQKVDEIVEEININSEDVIDRKKKKKKKKKHCFSNHLHNSNAEGCLAELPYESMPIKKVDRDTNEIIDVDGKNYRKFRHSNEKHYDNSKIVTVDNSQIVTKSQKKKKRKMDTTETMEVTKQINDTVENLHINTKKKKKIK